jgi:D-glycero-D-manno-heptose 1,7-bisphosphate phosphatase
MKLIILDRDGVINRDSDEYVKSVHEWQVLPGAFDAIARLCKHGFTVVVATNQSGLARGLFSLDDLEAMHDKMHSGVDAAGGSISGVYYCPHLPADHCQCRKPLPGMLDAIMRDYGVDSLRGVPIVGDSIRDLRAGRARNCQPLLVRTGKGKLTETLLPEDPELRNTPVFNDLAAIVDHLTANP